MREYGRKYGSTGGRTGVREYGSTGVRESGSPGVREYGREYGSAGVRGYGREYGRERVLYVSCVYLLEPPQQGTHNRYPHNRYPHYYLLEPPQQVLEAGLLARRGGQPPAHLGSVVTRSYT